MIKFLHHFSIGVSNLEQSKYFYNKYLDFKEIFRPDIGFPGAWMQLDKVQIHLIQREDCLPTSPLPSTVHTAFHTSLENLDEMEKILSADNIQYRRVVQKTSGINQLFFADPDGYHIELGFYPNQD